MLQSHCQKCSILLLLFEFVLNSFCKQTSNDRCSGGTVCNFLAQKCEKSNFNIYPDNSQKLRISFLAKTSYENYYFFCPEKLPTVQYNVLPVLCIHIYVMALEAVKNTGLSLTGSTWIQLVCVRKSTRLETLHIPHFCCIKRRRRRAMRARHN